MSLGVRSRGFSCHKMASTTATAVKRLRPTQASFCCKRFELQLAAVKCPQKYNFLICLLRKWKPRPPKLKTSFKVLFCHVPCLHQCHDQCMTAFSLKVLITGLIQHGFRHAWGRPQGDPGLENAGNQPETTMRNWEKLNDKILYLCQHP